MITIWFCYLSRRFTAPAERNVRWPGRMFPGPSCKVKSLQSWERRWTTNRSQKNGKLEKNIHFFITSSLLMHPISWALFFSGSSVFLMISEWVFVTRFGGPEFFFLLNLIFSINSRVDHAGRVSPQKAKTQQHETHTHYIGELFPFPDCWLNDFCPLFK